MDIDDVLDSAKKGKKKSKKNKVPTLEIDDKHLSNAINEFRESKNNIKLANAKCKSISECMIVPAAKDFHNKVSQEAGLVFKTVKIIDKDGESVDVDVAKNQYKAVSEDDIDEIKDIVGEDQFGELFESSMHVSLTKEALADQEIVMKLIKAVGKDNFAKYFTVNKVFVPNDAFHEARFIGKPRLKNRINKTIEEGLVNPFSPSVRA